MLGVALAVVFAAMLGVASIFSRRGLATGSFYALLVLSLAVGSVLFVPLAALTTGFADAPPRGVAYAAAGAVLGSVLARSLYFLGINYLGPGKALSVYATSPLYAAVLAGLVLGESITPLVVAGTLAIVVGIAALSRDVRAQTERENNPLSVVLYPLGGAVLASVAVTLRKLALTAGVVPIEAATVNMVVGLLVVVPLLATDWRRELLDIDRTAFRNFLAASTVMAVGFLVYFVGLRITDASVFFPLVQTQPLFAVALSALFLRQLEIVTRWTLLGSVVIVAGAALVVVG